LPLQIHSDNTNKTISFRKSTDDMFSGINDGEGQAEPEEGPP